jgi:hypothetical protein
LGGRGRWIS